jgi:hypothetical protein
MVSGKLSLLLCALILCLDSMKVTAVEQQPADTSSLKNQDTTAVDAGVLATSDTIHPSVKPAEATAAPARKLHSPSGAMWRSMLFPGWGQLYNRKYLKTLIIGGFEIGIITSIFVQDNRYRQARESGDEEVAEFYRDDRNRLTWWLAGTILFSMADAYVDAQLKDFDLKDDLSLAVFPHKLALIWKF